MREGADWISWGVRGPSRIGAAPVSAGSGSSPTTVSTVAIWSMSIPPGPMLSQSGTWEAPKCPPSAHWARLRGLVAVRNGAGAPAG